MAEEVRQIITREGPETIAAFIAEPVMGKGGVLLPPPGYSQRSSRSSTSMTSCLSSTR
jgi:4-aminobutyrate--pyruvate transaminase